ncbi:MAG: hypothetical protein JRF22_05910, partial [Deltaproteobacteria bacterium]|nr:hypothetical protein [Deltaproteobacteria bacterium]
KQKSSQNKKRDSFNNKPFEAIISFKQQILNIWQANRRDFQNKIIKEETPTDFILEIPPVRLPNIKHLLLKTYYRLKWFIVEAVPLFILGALLLFFMDRLLILEALEKLLSPVIVSFLGLPIKCVEAFLLCIARHEAGAVILMKLVKAGQLDYIQACVSIIIVTCFVPCFANIMAMIKKQKKKSALLMSFIITFASIMIGGIVNYLLRSFM